MMRRRDFITLLGGAAASPFSAYAQQAVSKMPRIGIIDPGAIRGDHFRQALRDLGYIEGQTVAFEYRSAEDKPDRLAAAAPPSSVTKSRRFTARCLLCFRPKA